MLLSHRPTPRNGRGLSLRLVKHCPPKIIAQTDPRALSTDCLGAGRGKAEQALLTVWERGEGLPPM